MNYFLECMLLFPLIARILGITRNDKGLNSQEARRLVDLIAHARDLDAAVAAAKKAFSFLVGQLHILGDSANGYPRNPVSAHVWKEGYSLVHTCDYFADAVARWGQRQGEEQATRLAATMAMQVVAHYPEEIFPRVFRNAKCCESLGMINEAVESYRCIVSDFERLNLEEILGGSEPFKESEIKILTSVREALTALQRLSPLGLVEAQFAFGERLNAALDSPERRDDVP